MSIIAEFVVEGVPKAASRGRASRKRMRDCQVRVRREAERCLPEPEHASFPWTEPVRVVLVYFRKLDGAELDVDNMAKPVLDALEGLIFPDDRLVVELVARRTDVATDFRVLRATPTLAEAIAASASFLLVRITSPLNPSLIP